MYEMQYAGTSHGNPSGYGQLSPRMGRQVNQQVQQVVAHTLVTSVQLSAAQYLTMTAMGHAAALAYYGQALANGDQYLAQQMVHLLNCYLGYAGQQICGIQASW
jgi:hypothetical protein